MCCYGKSFEILRLKSKLWSDVYNICVWTRKGVLHSLRMCVHDQSLRHVRLCKPLHCSPPDFSVHEILQARIRSGLSFPSLGDLPDPGIYPSAPAFPALVSRFFIGEPLWKPSLHMYAAAAAKSLQSCPTLCNPIDGSPPGSPVPEILQARTLEWGAISFSNAWKWKVKVKSLSHVQLCATPWIAAYQALPSTGFSRQEYWSGLPLPSPLYMLASYISPTGPGNVYSHFANDEKPFVGLQSACMLFLDILPWWLAFRARNLSKRTKSSSWFDVWTSNCLLIGPPKL